MKNEGGTKEDGTLGLSKVAKKRLLEKGVVACCRWSKNA